MRIRDFGGSKGLKTAVRLTTEKPWLSTDCMVCIIYDRAYGSIGLFKAFVLSAHIGWMYSLLWKESHLSRPPPCLSVGKWAIWNALFFFSFIEHQFSHVVVETMATFHHMVLPACRVIMLYSPPPADLS